MQILSVAALLLFSFQSFTQNAKIYNARYLQTPPVYPAGIDSCQRFYLSQYKAMDSVLYKVVANGDTAKYIRIYFSFSVDKYGSVYNARFERIASTQYAKGITARTINYFSSTEYYHKMIKEMMIRMPLWKPALVNGMTVDCRISHYLQFWVGAKPPG